MSKIKHLIVTALFAGSCFVANSAISEEQSTEQAPDKVPFNVSEITCWNVTTLPEQEAAYAMLLVYGYNVGRLGLNTTTGEHITKTIQASAEYCAANPDALVIEVIATR